MAALDWCGSYTVYVSVEIGGQARVRIACIWIGFSDTVTQNLAKFARINVYLKCDAKDA